MSKLPFRVAGSFRLAESLHRWKQLNFHRLIMSCKNKEGGLTSGPILSILLFRIAYACAFVSGVEGCLACSFRFSLNLLSSSRCAAFPCPQLVCLNDMLSYREQSVQRRSCEPEGWNKCSVAPSRIFHMKTVIFAPAPHGE